MGGLMRPLRGERPDAHHPGSSLSFTNSWPASGRGTCKNCPGNPSEIKDAGTILDPVSKKGRHDAVVALLTSLPALRPSSACN
jgi:hypothetical protein